MYFKMYSLFMIWLSLASRACIVNPWCQLGYLRVNHMSDHIKLADLQPEGQCVSTTQVCCHHYYWKKNPDYYLNGNATAAMLGLEFRSLDQSECLDFSSSNLTAAQSAQWFDKFILFQEQNLLWNNWRSSVFLHSSQIFVLWLILMLV